MGLFGTVNPMSERFDELMDQLSELKTQVAELKGDRAGVSKAIKLETELSKLKRDLTDKQIEFDREQEKWDREKREVDHMVGLQRKRGDFEIKAAGREATLAVREENLKSEREQFEKQTKFRQDQFDQQFDSLNGLMEKFLERMPTTKQLITVGGRNGDDE
jgi:regulator of replication initiation timing